MRNTTMRKTTTTVTIRPGFDHEAFRRWLALVQWSVDTGRKLPMSPAMIMAYEDQGFIVDLETGAVNWERRLKKEGAWNIWSAEVA